MPSYTIEESITYLLKNTAGISAKVSTRVYPDLAADNAVLPYIVWTVEGEVTEQTFATPTSGWLRQATIVVSCWADRLAAGTKTARDTAEAVYSAFVNYTGTPIVGGKTILAVVSMEIAPGTDYDSGYDDQRVSRDVRITLWYR